MRGSVARLLLMASVLASACAAPRPAEPVSPLGGGGAPVIASAAPVTLVIGNDAAIEGFGEMFAGGKSGPEQLQGMVHRVLARVDDTTQYIPGIAAELPSPDK
jgi:hypothetical protein